MVSWTFHLFSLLLLVASNTIRVNLNTLPIQQSNINDNYISSFADEWLSIKEKSQYAVDRLQCSRGWQRFGGSCYHLSNVTSTSAEANKICKLHYLNNSQLMQILYPFEIYFAAHVLNKNNLSELLLQINLHLSKGKKFGKVVSSNEDSFRQDLLTYYNRKAKRSAQSQDDEGVFYDTQIHNITNTQTDWHSKKEKFDSFSVNNTEEFDSIRKACNKLSWNVFNSDTDVFLLTIIKDLTSNQTICFINNIESDGKYQHICQYVLDSCFGNDRCGNHGRCVNKLLDFNCSCYFYRDGQYCETTSTIFIHLLIGFSSVVFFFILKKFQPQRYFQKQPITSNSTTNHENNLEQMTASRNEIQQYNVSRLRLLWSLMFIIIFCSLCFIPAFCHWNTFKLYDNDQLKFGSLINNTVRSITQCNHNSIWFIDNSSFVIISLLFCLIFSFEITRKSDCLNVCNGCLSPIEPFTIMNRYETAVLCGIVVLDVLMTLEHFFLNLNELWNRSVLIQFLDRTLIPFLYGVRYYPLFASLQQRNRYVRGLAFIYILINIIYIIIRRSLCMDFLSLSKKYSPSEEAQHRFDLGNWAIFYGLIKSIPQFILLSYISAEFLARFVFGSTYPYDINILNKSSRSITSTDESDMDSSSDSNCWSNIRNSIYQWDKDFRYTTMAMCAYTIAFVLLFYLTSVFAFQFIMGTSSMSFLIFCLKNIFNIEIDTWSFRYEILISAFLIFLIFANRFLRVMMKYKKHTKDLQKNNYEEIPQLDESEKKSIAHKSIGYLTSVLLNIVGGFFIWFHIILFIIIIFRIILFYIFTLQIHRIELILTLFSIIAPMLVLYGLKKYITEWLCTFITIDQSSNRNNKFYGILVYFTLLIGCHIAIVSTFLRLVQGILYNILLMPRVDSSHFGQKYQKEDSAYMAYVSFLYVEKDYRSLAKSIPAPDSAKSLIEEIQMLLNNPVKVKEESRKDTNVTLSDSAQSLIEEEEEEVQMLVNNAVKVKKKISEDTIDMLSNSTTQQGEEEKYSSGLSTPKQLNALDDRLSIASTRTSSTIHRTNLIDTAQDRIFPIPNNTIQESDFRNRIRHKGKLPMSSTPVDSEDEDNRPALPLSTYKRNTSKPSDPRFHSTDV